MRRLAATGSRQTSRPQTRTVPDVGGCAPTTERMSVVLPAPLWPMKPQISPGATASERSLTATLPRYSFR